MGIWNKIWGKIQEQTKIDSAIYDSERKLIDIPSLLNCSIKEICELNENQKENFIQDCNQKTKQIDTTLLNLKNNLEKIDDANTKKQLEHEIKQQENLKAKFLQIIEILNDKELKMHYLINYQERLNVEQFLEDNKVINIFEQFRLSPQFSPEDLITARETLENNAYTLPVAEKNNLIDQINKNYEILVDSVRLKGYRDILENPETITILANHISELQKQCSNIETNSIENNIQPETYTKEKDIESLDFDEIPPIEPITTNVSTSLNNINKELLEEQKQQLEEQLIPQLATLNQQIKESKNELLILAKTSLLKQHQNILNQNIEYQKILEELAKLN